MKNIHLVPTDKPSRLCIDNSCDELNYCDVEGLSTKHTKNQHIYITSDEEIKDGEYGICLNLVREGLKSQLAVFKMDCDQRHSIELLGGQKKAEILKVIMATDRDLIEDEVQAIDDEFLEWFVINPSCKFVEIHTYSKKIGTETDKNGYREMNVFGNHYKIIIPQEEPKQETLEEAADIMSTDVEKVHPADSYIFKQGFLEGAKSDAARDYWFEQFKKKQ